MERNYLLVKQFIETYKILSLNLFYSIDIRETEVMLQGNYRSFIVKELIKIIEPSIRPETGYTEFNIVYEGINFEITLT